MVVQEFKLQEGGIGDKWLFGKSITGCGPRDDLVSLVMVLPMGAPSRDVLESYLYGKLGVDQIRTTLALQWPKQILKRT